MAVPITPTYEFLSTLSLRRATINIVNKIKDNRFLSTLSLRRATTDGLFFLSRRENFYPRSPCGERPKRWPSPTWTAYFYPRSPCGERRLRDVYVAKVTQFLSTLSLRRATSDKNRRPRRGLISIHALLAESDTVNIQRPAAKNDFYPRSPCGERLSTLIITICIVLFLSTLSLRRATSGSVTSESRYRHFYPRSPCGERRVTYVEKVPADVFLSTLSLRRATSKSDTATAAPLSFLSTLSLRRATTEI